MAHESARHELGSLDAWHLFAKYYDMPRDQLSPLAELLREWFGGVFRETFFVVEYHRHLLIGIKDEADAALFKMFHGEQFGRVSEGVPVHSFYFMEV